MGQVMSDGKTYNITVADMKKLLKLPADVEIMSNERYISPDETLLFVMRTSIVDKNGI